MAIAVIAWLFLAVAVAGLVVRHLDSDRQAVVLVASAAWLLGLAVLPAAVLLVLGRHWWALVVVVLVVAVQVHDYGPWFRAQTAPPGTAITVMSQNLRLGRADAHSVVDHVRAEHVDVLVLQELTADERGRLRAAGLDDLLPHSVASPGDGIRGNGVWSRLPMTAIGPGGGDLAPGLVLVTVDVGTSTLTVVGVHASSPYRDAGQWAETLTRANVVSRSLASTGPAVAAGDFNATLDHAPFRALLGGGWSDGAEQAGAGVVRTWPADSPLPPLLGLDHVLTHGVVAESMRTVETPGSDHRGLVARIVLPAVT